MWMRTKGVRFQPIYGRQAFNVGGRFKFWGGLTVEAWGGGPGLIDALHAGAKHHGIDVWYHSRALELEHDDNGVTGVVVRREGRAMIIAAKAVVLAAGGFEANAEWRTRYLGPGWDLAKVRGTRFNTGDGIRMALEIGAMPYGNWSGCHAVGWDRNAPEFGDLSVGDGFQKHSYPFGIMVNGRGRRFVDEGADFRNYTYAKYGRVILEQPGQFAWQVFDRKVTHLLRDEYRIKRVTKVSADTLEALAGKLEDVDAAAFLDEIKTYNAAVDSERRIQPEHQGWTADPRSCGRQDQLGQYDRHAAVRGLRGDLRSDLHLRRPARRSTGARDQHRRRSDRRPGGGGRTGRRTFLLQLSGRHRPDVGLGVRADRREQRRARRDRAQMNSRDSRGRGNVERSSSRSRWAKRRRWNAIIAAGYVSNPDRCVNIGPLFWIGAIWPRSWRPWPGAKNAALEAGLSDCLCTF